MMYARVQNKIIDITDMNIKDSYYNLQKNDIYIGCPYKTAENICDLIEEEDLCEFVLNEKTVISSFTISKGTYATLYKIPGTTFIDTGIVSIWVKDSVGRYSKIAEKREGNWVLL